MRHDPVIVMAMHRSGSTFLTRILNASPNLAVWGEHGGFLAGLQESMIPVRDRLGKGNRSGFDYSTAQQRLKNNFIPFMNPFAGEEYREAVRDMLSKLFSTGLPDNTRWGFKELRYLSKNMLDWFFFMYPEAQIIFNLRDPVELCSSSLRAAWVVERLAKGVNGYTKDKLPEVVFNTLVKIHTLEKLSMYALSTYGTEKVKVVWYEDLVDAPLVHSELLFRFLKDDNFSIDHIEQTAKHKVGHAKKFTSDEPPELNPSSLKSLAKELSHDALSIQPPDGIQVTNKWNFCVGVIGSDMFSYNTRI